MTTETLLQISGLRVGFAGSGSITEVVHGLDLEVARGETVALVGESGSGKSVTAMSVLGLLPDTARRSGSIRFLGQELLEATPAELRRVRGNQISMIFQEPMTSLNPVYRIGAQIVRAVRAHRNVTPAEAHAIALELLEQVNMPDPERRIRSYPHELSGGQRQRAMIAMAIAAEPDLLIADEPTTALDVTVQAEILDLLLDLQQRLDMGILIITHDMGVVADIADRVVVMRNGDPVESAPTAELFARPREPYTRELLAAVGHFGNAERPNSGGRGDREQLLTVRDLVVHYPGRIGSAGFTAVNEVSFDIRRGEVVGLVGESGSGKSTIGRSLVGLSPVTRGTASFDGVDLRTATKREWRGIRRRMAMVFQDPGSSLNPRETIGSSIVAPLRWSGAQRNRRELDSRARELLDMVRLPGEWVSRHPHELSGGQRQRVGIARALAANPALLIADEPTSALDVSVQATVLEIFQELQRDLGFSCLFITHDLSVVEQLADHVVVLEHGTIVEQGDVEAVLMHPVQEYTQALIAAAPVPDPIAQRAKRELRRALRATHA